MAQFAPAIKMDTEKKYVESQDHMSDANGESNTLIE